MKIYWMIRSATQRVLFTLHRAHVVRRIYNLCYCEYMGQLPLICMWYLMFQHWRASPHFLFIITLKWRLIFLPNTWYNGFSTAVIWLLTFCVFIFSMINGLYELKKKTNWNILGATLIMGKVVTNCLFILATSALYHKPVASRWDLKSLSAIESTTSCPLLMNFGSLFYIWELCKRWWDINPWFAKL